LSFRLYLGSDYDPLPIFATLVAIWVPQLLFSVWQSVGVWRSAGRYIADRLAAGKRAVWGWLARAGVLLSVAMILFAFARQGRRNSPRPMRWRSATTRRFRRSQFE
jgi:hypothetical protein